MPLLLISFALAASVSALVLWLLAKSEKDAQAEKRIGGLSAYELGESGDRRAVPHLRVRLTSPNANSRRLAASAIRKLSRRCPEECNALVPDLLERLDDPSPQVRQYALNALSGMTVMPSARPAIKRVADGDEKEYNRRAARRVLSHMENGDTPSVREGRASKDRNGRGVVIGDEVIPFQALGKARKSGRPIKALEARSLQGPTRLVPISYAQVADYLVMAYLPSDLKASDEEVQKAFEEQFGVSLRKGRDVRGRTYWWRPVGLRSTATRGRLGVDATTQSLYYREYPELRYMDHADHWIELADDIGCDPLTLAANLD